MTAATGGAAQSDICVYATDTSGDRLGSATTADDGTYTITGLATGSYDVEFTDACGSTGDFLLQWYDDHATELTSTPVSVTAGSTVTSINAALQTGGAISGTVTAATGGGPERHLCGGHRHLG